MWFAALILAATSGPSLAPSGGVTLSLTEPVRAGPVRIEPAAGARAQKKKQKQPEVRPITPFREDLVAARKDARERNVPILILMALEGEEASDRFRDKVLPSLTLARACDRAVVLFTNNGIHDTVTIKELVEGYEEERVVCSQYKTPSCTIHQRVWDQVFLEFNRDGEIKLPHVLVLKPDGTLFSRISTRDVPSIKGITLAVEGAQKEAGPGLTTAELRTVRGALLPARRNTELKDWARAWRQWLEVIAVIDRGPYAEEAFRGIEVAAKGVREEIAYAAAKLVPGDASRGYELLLELRREVEGLPIVDELEDRIRQAERDKTLRDEIKAFKLELEARKQLDQAFAFLDAKNERKAERAVRKLLKSKRLAGTEAVRKAREAFPQWAER